MSFVDDDNGCWSTVRAARSSGRWNMPCQLAECRERSSSFASASTR
jgi:hypothetical protein